jgi:hypothetical protein
MMNEENKLRYVSYMEDGGMVWSQTFTDNDTAIRSMLDSVAQRQECNGGGWGVVVDVWADNIVAQSADAPSTLEICASMAWTFCRGELSRSARQS